MRNRNSIWILTKIQIIASSKYLGYIPTDLPGQDSIAWIPVDILSRILFELVEADFILPSTPDRKGESNTQYYHLANPTSSTWSSLVPTIQDFYASQPLTIPTTGTRKPLKPVPFSTWLLALEQSADASDVDVEVNPAIKLLTFYRGMKDRKSETVLATERAKEKSASLRALKGVGKEWMGVWLRQWEGGSGLESE